MLKDYTTVWWLCVKIYKHFYCAIVLLYVFKALNCKAPAYISDILECYHPSRPLRSMSQHNLLVPKSKLKTAGDRAFSVIGPVYWNALPTSLKYAKSVNIFKHNLKTHLFTIWQLPVGILCQMFTLPSHLNIFGSMTLNHHYYYYYYYWHK